MKQITASGICVVLLCVLLYISQMQAANGAFGFSSEDTANHHKGMADYRRIVDHKYADHEYRCGIVWIISTANGTNTDFMVLDHLAGGLGRYRLLMAMHEVLVSADRVRNSFRLNSTIPSVCGNKLPEITLFADRNILTYYWSPKFNLFKDAQRIFDRIVYFDDLPLQHLDFVLGQSNATSTDMIDVNAKARVAAIDGSKVYRGTNDALQRLPARVNVLKLAALLSTPYRYTLYLDGDTAPCEGFQMAVFAALQENDILTTMNTFGYVSTGGKKLYPGAPAPRVEYAKFPEPNGGILAFRWNSRVQSFFMRAISLIPSFAKLGYDQDQAYLRHALFETLQLQQAAKSDQEKQLIFKHKVGLMRHYCRSGWNCDRNTCKTGCLIIHQRLCLIAGVPPLSSVLTAAADRTFAKNKKHASRTSTSASGKSSQTNKQKVKYVMTLQDRAVFFARKYVKTLKHYKRNGINSSTTSMGISTGKMNKSKRKDALDTSVNYLDD